MSAWPSKSEHYEESLKLTSLRDGRVLASFDFKTVLHDAIPRDPRTLGEQDDRMYSLRPCHTHADCDRAAQHYNVFPLALGQILREHAIAELDLTLNAGRWRYDDWGAPSSAIGSLGTGGELKAWMADGGPKSYVQSLYLVWQTGAHPTPGSTNDGPVFDMLSLACFALLYLLWIANEPRHRRTPSCPAHFPQSRMRPTISVMRLCQRRTCVQRTSRLSSSCCRARHNLGMAWAFTSAGILRKVSWYGWA
jgi:hypothetical protein